MNDPAERTERLPMAWNGQLETGVATIDLQHKVLFDLLLRTQEACARGRWIDLDGLLPRLRSYADYHFRYEEDWIRRHAPGGATQAAHAHQHAGFLSQLDRWEQHRVDGHLQPTSVLSYLRDWLVNHIAQQDVPLIRGLAQRGEGPAYAAAPTVSATSATPSTRPVIRSPETTAPTPSGVPV